MKRHFAFLPDARTPLAAQARPPQEGGRRRRLDAEVEVLRDGARAAGTSPVAIGTELLSAGDIVALDRRAIALLEPRRGAQAVEPNYFPYVDLVDADLPWRYSLDTSSGHRVQPWLALIALRPTEFEDVEQGSAPLPRIRVAHPSASLPPIGALWASAHVHVDRGDDDATPVEQVANRDPSAQLARILCLRQLDERERYELFLVPTFDAGRCAGLGRRGEPDPWDAPAWKDDDEPVELPVYLRSHFVTSALEDFELLVRRLRARPASEEGIGRSRIASAARPGYYADQDRPGRAFEVQAAMRPPGSSLPDHEPDELTDRLAGTLTQVIEGESIVDDGPDAEDPLVAMPAYGWRFRHEREVDPGRTSDGWFHRLNLDLALRQVAGLGARTARAHQEEFVAAAWDQYEKIVEANRLLSRLELADQLTGRLADRRLERLPAEVRLTLEEPLHAVATVGDRPVAQMLATGGVPRSFASVELRRAAARRSVRLTDSPEGTRTLLPSPSIPGDTTPDHRFEQAARQPRERVRAEALRGSLAEVSGRLFRAGAQEQQGPRSLPHPVTPFSSEDVAAQVGSVLKRLPKAKADMLVVGRSVEEGRRIAPVMRAPRIPVPLAARLEQVAAEALLTGVEDLPDDTVTVVEENRSFVEAFLVGANHELNHELRWRQFPTDMRGTVLPRFWDRGYGDHDRKGDDSRGIHTWSERIGRNFPAGADGEADLVLVLRGGIVRKLGKLVVVLNEATGTQWRAPHEAEAGTDHQPVFDGGIGDDVAYYGFDVPRMRLADEPERFFFVLYEPQHRLRFGLDIATATARRERFRPTGASLPFQVAAVAGRRPAIDRLWPAHSFRGPPPTPSATPETWADLSQTHVTFGRSRYLDPDAPVSVQDGPDLWGSARTSASIARSLWQKPVAAVLPARRIL